MIKNLDNIEILKNNDLNSKFLTANLDKLKLYIKIYKGDFSLDSLNYFPITRENYSFLEVFRWKGESKYNHFFTKKFYENFNKEKINFKTFDDTIVIGSSPGNNYFRNLLTFIPRNIFVPVKEINIAIHRNSSNKLRKFIDQILKLKNIEIKKF